MRTELDKGRALSQLLAEMEHDGMVKREVRGRRTLSIALLDDWGLVDEWRDRLAFTSPVGLSGVNDRLQPVGVNERDRSQPVGDDGDVDYEALAAALLAEVIKRANAPASQGAELERLRGKVADLTQDLTDSRNQLATWMSEAQEQKRQADSMRASLLEVRAELDRKPARGGASLREIVGPKGKRTLDRLLRDLPSEH